jgi:MAP/microtubule affinity-regulating kinase
MSWKISNSILFVGWYSLLTIGCEKLLKKFLVRDPTRRGSLEIVIDDPWINESYDHSPISTDLSTSVTEDEAIIHYIEQKYKIEKDVILQAIRENIYNDLSAIYYMMYFEKQSKEMNGEKAELPPVDGADVTKMDTPKKESISSPPATPANLMPVIDEDGVLPESVVPSSKPEDAKSTEVQSAVTSKPPVVVARRRRAATVTGDGANDSEPSPFQPAVPINQAPHIGHVRPASAHPATQTTIPIQTTDDPKTGHQTSQSAAPAPEPRKRTNTIVGIFKGVGVGKKDDDDSSSTHGPEDADKPRSLRFTFNSNSTSSKPPDEIMVELARCCNKLTVPHRLITRYLMECNPPQTGKEQLKMEIEVCKLPRLNNLHGLRFKRVSGSSSEYKELCEKILATIQL